MQKDRSVDESSLDTRDSVLLIILRSPILSIAHVKAQLGLLTCALVVREVEGFGFMSATLAV